MNTRTRIIIGATVLLLGAGLIGLGFVDQESNIRQVVDVLAEPDAHATGTYTLIGVPQPETLTTFGDGQTVQSANPAFQNSTRHVVRWEHDGVMHLSTITTTVRGPDEAGISHWHLENVTRTPGGGQETRSNTTWTIDRPHMVFLIQGFTAEGEPPMLWGVYEGVLTMPMQPKPSQFTGRIAHDAAGTPLPADALVYTVDEYTAGCSSKFLPPEVVEEYEDDPDVQ